MAEKEATELLAVARIGAPKGIDGFLRLHTYSGEHRHLSKLSEVLLAPVGKPQEGKIYRIRAIDAGDWGIGMAFQGYLSPETARALTGLELFLPRSKACPLAPDEWYIRDLIGMNLVMGGKILAKVTAVLDGGADPLLEVTILSSGASCLVPFRNQFIGAVDIAAGTMELLVEWILE
jgi:16S rRNA processing protein RimM